MNTGVARYGEGPLCTADALNHPRYMMSSMRVPRKGIGSIRSGERAECFQNKLKKAYALIYLAVNTQASWFPSEMERGKAEYEAGLGLLYA